MEKKKLRIGIVGLRRGADFFPAIMYENVEVVAVCETEEWKIERAKKRYIEAGGTKEFTVYRDFDQFLEHEMDGVMLINFFDNHTPLAIKCLEKNISVLCETQCSSTMAECVALVRAAEKSKAHFMLLENYPYMLFNLEMKKVMDEGTLGKFHYAEGEYNHPMQPNEQTIKEYFSLGERHWRRWLPKTYYLTHSLAPLMYISGARPKQVQALPILHPNPSNFSMVGEVASVMTTLNDDGSVFRFFGNSNFGFEENSYRFCCRNGQIENRRGAEREISLVYNSWSVPEGREQINQYTAEWSDDDKDIASRMGHCGGDYFIIREFFDLLRENKKNPFDVYFATTLASVAILAHRSQIEKGVPYEVPDFRKEEDRVKWENDTLTPFWGYDGTPPSIQCCTNPDYKPTDEMYQWFKEIHAKVKED